MVTSRLGDIRAVAHPVPRAGGGETPVAEVEFIRTQRRVDLIDPAETYLADREGIRASVLLADCCGYASGTVYQGRSETASNSESACIGAKRTISWGESTTFASAFYGAYFRERRMGLKGLERGLRAGQRPITGYEAIVAGRCPFRALELEPRLRAKKTWSQ